MKFVVDMNLSTRWVHALKEAGYAAEHWSALGPSTATDTEIAAVAREQGAVVLTRDLDFSAIIATTRLAKPSIVHMRDRDRFDEATVQRLLITLKAFEAELTAGAVLTIAGHRARLRLLPLSQGVQQ